MVTVQSKEFIDEQLSKLVPIRYNRFQWWRNFDCKQPLHKYQRIPDRFANGDFDVSHYYWQAQNAIHEMNEKLSKEQSPDKQWDIRGLYMEKYRRLIQDFEKDEKERIQAFKMAMRQETGIKLEELETLMETFDGTLLDLFYYVEEQNRQKVQQNLKQNSYDSETDS